MRATWAKLLVGACCIAGAPAAEVAGVAAAAGSSTQQSSLALDEAVRQLQEAVAAKHKAQVKSRRGAAAKLQKAKTETAEARAWLAAANRRFEEAIRAEEEAKRLEAETSHWCDEEDYADCWNDNERNAGGHGQSLAEVKDPSATDGLSAIEGCAHVSQATPEETLAALKKCQTALESLTARAMKSGEKSAQKNEEYMKLWKGAFNILNHMEKLGEASKAFSTDNERVRKQLLEELDKAKKITQLSKSKGVGKHTVSVATTAEGAPAL